MLDDEIIFELERLDPSCSGDKWIFDTLTELRDLARDAADAEPAEIMGAARKALDKLESAIAVLQDEVSVIEEVISLAEESIAEKQEAEA